MVLLALFLALPARAAEMELKGYVSSWIQDCTGTSCSLPRPSERNRPVLLRLTLPDSPGQASSAISIQELALPGETALGASLSFFSICPYVGLSGCAGRYFQAQAVLTGPAGAFCAAAFNLQDFSPFPVLMCAGSGPGGTRYGLTLHRNPL